MTSSKEGDPIIYLSSIGGGRKVHNLLHKTKSPVLEHCRLHTVMRRTAQYALGPEPPSRCGYGPGIRKSGQPAPRPEG